MKNRALNVQFLIFDYPSKTESELILEKSWLFPRR